MVKLLYSCLLYTSTYYYYKCGNAKRHGKAHCDLKAIRKEPLERFVVDTAIKVIFNDEIIEQLIDLIMEAQQQENTRLPVLKDQLRDTEKRLANLLEAIEPVSYTHLDVYKRQAHARRKLHPVLRKRDAPGLSQPGLGLIDGVHFPGRDRCV